MKPDVASRPTPTDRVISILNLVLADECLLYTKTRNSHLKTADSGPLRDALARQFDELSEMINDISERIRSLGGYPMGTMSDFLQHARLKENSEASMQLPALRMMGQLHIEHQLMIRELRGDAEACLQEYSETAVSEFLNGLVARHEAMAQTLREHLAKS